jgi:hypothetical protein
MIAHFSKPEYVHVLLNPLPVYGLAVGVIVAHHCAFVENQRSSRNRAGACNGERCVSVASLLLWRSRV